MKFHPLAHPNPKEARPQAAVSVSEVVFRWNQVLRELGAVQVMGELSEWSVARSGHAYFTISDGRSSMRCILWKDRLRSLAWQPQAGEQVLINGRAQVYTKSGSASFETYAMFPAGEGLQALALKALEERLAAEGLFHPDLKKPLPQFPRTVGVVSSSRADGLRDFLRSRALRAPGVAILFAEASVQGATAAEECAAALKRLDESGRCDVLALVRGGGAAADLLPFSEEVLVRAVAATHTPVVVGVGHEPDHPIAERAADAVAHTPTHAAELIFPDLRAHAERLDHLGERLGRPLRQLIASERQRLVIGEHRLRGATLDRLSDARRRLNAHNDRLTQAHPAQRLRRRHHQLAALGQRLGQTSPDTGLASARGQWKLIKSRMNRAGQQVRQRSGDQIAQLARRLEAASPKAVLERGYALIVDESGKPLTSAHATSSGQAVRLQFADGERRARIEGDDDV